jgi:cyclophilin family peptidyl-prolyl cis-trans isomerase
MGYTIYGEVIKGMDVVDKIAAVKTDKNDRPLKPVRIWTIKLIEKKKKR